MREPGDASLLMEAATELVTLMGQVALGHFRRELAIERKADGSPVTAADRGAEEAARAWLSERFPSDGVLGEELGERVGSSGRRWVVDPIDGTKAFVRGVPLWGSMAALCEGEGVLVGAVSFPATGDLLVAAPGMGCWNAGARCAVSTVGRLADATVLTTDDRFLRTPARGERWRRLGEHAAVSRTWGDCFGYLLVATGRAEVMADPVLSVWDAAPLQPIIVEAGGVFTDWRGRATAFGGDAIATNMAVASQVRGILVNSTDGEARDG